MKIAVLSFTQDKVGRGVERAVSELEKRWRKKNEVVVFSALSLRMKVDWKRYLGKGSILRMFMADYLAFKTVEFTIRALFLINKERIDIIMPMNGGWQSLLVRLYCWIRSKKMVVGGNAGLGWCDRWNILMCPDVFVALSKRNAKWARKYSEKLRIETILYGVDLKKFKMKGRKIKLDLERPIILCVAGEDRYKRVEETIEAVTKLKKGSLLLTTGGKEQEKLGKKRLKRRFLRMDLESDRISDLYRSVNVFTLASEESEAFGIVYPEALASGLPIVATDDELRRELLGKYGVYVKDPTDSEEYAQKLKMALRKKKVRPEKWLEKFDWDKIALKYERLFEGLLKNE